MSCFKQALLTPAHLRKNETFARVGAGFGVSEATAWRYVDETLDVLAAWPPGPHEALAGLADRRHPQPLQPYRRRRVRPDRLRPALITAAGPDATTLHAFLPLLLITFVEVARVVLPEMTERGDGAFLMAIGYPAARRRPERSDRGHGGCPEPGAHSERGSGRRRRLRGHLAVGSLILNSDTAVRLSTPGQHPEIPDEILEAITTAHPDELADHCWDMYTKRDRVEHAHPAELPPAPASA
ncbi:hypothetical protein GCM10010327_41750 [Streptomyces nitrosporeus]|nr:hypothetical protein GCM10010327_41750 [Streptomyces nitrosporeus]